MLYLITITSLSAFNFDALNAMGLTTAPNYTEASLLTLRPPLIITSSIVFSAHTLISKISMILARFLSILRALDVVCTPSYTRGQM